MSAAALLRRGFAAALPAASTSAAAGSLLAMLVVAAARLPATAGADAARPLAAWLHLPAFAATLAAVVATVEGWPPLARDRADAALVRRACLGPLGGSGAVALGALAALAGALVAAGLLFALGLRLLGVEPPPIRVHRALSAFGGRAILDLPGERLLFRGEAAAPACALRINPMAAPRAAAPVGSVLLGVRVDGEDLGRVRVEGSFERIELPLSPPRPVAEVAVTMLDDPDDGGLVLMFGADAVELVDAEAQPFALAAVLGALGYVGSAMLVLTLACAFAGMLALPVLTFGCVGLLAIAPLVGLTPERFLVDAAAAGRWPGARAAAAHVLPVPVAAPLLLAAVAWRRRRRWRGAAR